MQSDPSTQIRGNRKSAIAGTLIGWLMRIIGVTVRIDLQDLSGIGSRTQLQAPSILVLWHNRFFAVAPVWEKLCGHRPTVALTSASKDGDMVARALGVFGMQAVRGSSSRRAVAALVGLKRALRDGMDVCITPDGPRGPRYVMQPGVVKIAQSSGAPIQPIHVRFSSAWRLPTWDRYVIPKPFSRVEIIFDHLITVPKNLDEQGFELENLRIQKLMTDATDDAD